jgi:ABC-2 type transport system ATP-binding protein
MLATLLRPDAGTASIFGHDVQREAQIVRQLIGVTGQYASVDEKLSATENLIIFSRLLGLGRAEARRKTRELLEEFGLTEAAKRPLAKFSGGMRRRLDLAASLIAQPPLIFLDEPTTGLDPRTRAQMWDTIRRLVSTGSTVLLTTQYLDEADQLADRIAVIDRGRVVAEGTADDLKASVGTSALVLRLADQADTDDTIRAIQTVLGVQAAISPEAARITAPMANPDRVTDLLITLREAGIGLTEMSVQKPTLDEVFLTITGHGAEERDAADAQTTETERVGA